MVSEKDMKYMSRKRIYKKTYLTRFNYYREPLHYHLKAKMHNSRYVAVLADRKSFVG